MSAAPAMHGSVTPQHFAERLTKAAVIAFETAFSVWRTAYIRRAPLNKHLVMSLRCRRVAACERRHFCKFACRDRLVSAQLQLYPVSSHLASHTSTSLLSAAFCHNYRHPFPESLASLVMQSRQEQGAGSTIVLAVSPLLAADNHLCCFKCSMPFTSVALQRPFPKDVDEQRVHAVFAVYGRCVSLLS